MSRSNGIVTVIDNHPDRDKILRRLLQGESARSLSREYGIDHSAFSRTRKNLQKRVEPIITASLSQIDPEFAAKTTEARPFSIWNLVEDLNESRHELAEIKHRPDAKPHHQIQAISTEARVAEVLAKIAETAAKHRDISHAPEYQRLQYAVARTIRRVPQAAPVFREEFQRMSNNPTEEAPIDV